MTTEKLSNPFDFYSRLRFAICDRMEWQTLDNKKISREKTYYEIRSKLVLPIDHISFECNWLAVASGDELNFNFPHWIDRGFS